MALATQRNWYILNSRKAWEHPRKYRKPLLIVTIQYKSWLRCTASDHLRYILQDKRRSECGTLRIRRMCWSEDKPLSAICTVVGSCQGEIIGYDAVILLRFSLARKTHIIPHFFYHSLVLLLNHLGPEDKPVVCCTKRSAS